MTAEVRLAEILPGLERLARQPGLLMGGHAFRHYGLNRTKTTSTSTCLFLMAGSSDLADWFVAVYCAVSPAKRSSKGQRGGRTPFAATLRPWS